MIEDILEIKGDADDAKGASAAAASRPIDWGNFMFGAQDEVDLQQHVNGKTGEGQGKRFMYFKALEPGCCQLVFLPPLAKEGASVTELRVHPEKLEASIKEVGQLEAQPFAGKGGKSALETLMEEYASGVQIISISESLDLTEVSSESFLASLAQSRTKLEGGIASEVSVAPPKEVKEVKEVKEKKELPPNRSMLSDGWERAPEIADIKPITTMLIGGKKRLVADLLGFHTEPTPAQLQGSAFQEKQQRLAEPAFPGQHSAGDTYAYALDGKAINPSDHQRLVSKPYEMGGKQYRFTNHNIGGPNPSGNSIGYADFSQDPIARKEVLRSRGRLIGKDWLAAAQDEMQSSGMTGVQENWLEKEGISIEEMVQLIEKATGKTIRILRSGTLLHLYSDEFELIEDTVAKRDDASIESSSAIFKVKDSDPPAYVCAHVGHLQPTLSNSDAWQVIQKLRDSGISAMKVLADKGVVPANREYHQVLLLDINKERRRQGSSQLVPVQYRRTKEGKMIQGTANTDAILVWSEKTGKITDLGDCGYVYDGRVADGKQEGGTWLNPNEPKRLDAYSLTVQEELCRVRGLPPMTDAEWDFEVLELKDEKEAGKTKVITLRDFQAELSSVMSSAEVMEACCWKPDEQGFVRYENCFLQIKFEKTRGSEDDEARSFWHHLRGLLQRHSFGRDQIEFVINTLGGVSGREDYLINIPKPGIMLQVREAMQLYASYAPVLRAWRVLCPGINIDIGYEQGKWQWKISAEQEEGEMLAAFLRTKFKTEFEKTPLDDPKNIKARLLALKQSVEKEIPVIQREKTEIEELQTLFCEKTGDKKLRLKRFPKEDGKHSGEIRIAVQYDADYIGRLEALGFKHTGAGFLYASPAVVQKFKAQEFKKPQKSTDYETHRNSLLAPVQRVMNNYNINLNITDESFAISVKPPAYDYFIQVMSHSDLSLKKDEKNIVYIPHQEVKKLLTEILPKAYRKIKGNSLEDCQGDLRAMTKDNELLITSVRREDVQPNGDREYQYIVTLGNKGIFDLSGVSKDQVRDEAGKFSCTFTHQELEAFYDRLKEEQEKIIKGGLSDSKRVKHENKKLEERESEGIRLLSVEFLREISEPLHTGFLSSKIRLEPILMEPQRLIVCAPFAMINSFFAYVRDKKPDLLNNIKRGLDISGEFREMYLPAEGVSVFTEFLNQFSQASPELIKAQDKLKAQLSVGSKALTLVKVMVDVPIGFKYGLKIAKGFDIVRDFFEKEFVRQGVALDKREDFLIFPVDKLPAVQSCIDAYEQAYCKDAIFSRSSLDPKKPSIDAYRAWLNPFFGGVDIGRTEQGIDIEFAAGGMTSEIMKMVAEGKAVGAVKKGNFSISIARNQIGQFDEWLIKKTDFLPKAIVRQIWELRSELQSKEGAKLEQGQGAPLAGKEEQSFQNNMIPLLLQPAGVFKKEVFERLIKELAPKDQSNKTIKDPVSVALQTVASQLGRYTQGKSEDEEERILQAVFDPQSGFSELIKTGSSFWGVNSHFKRFQEKLAKLQRKKVPAITPIISSSGLGSASALFSREAPEQVVSVSKEEKKEAPAIAGIEEMVKKCMILYPESIPKVASPGAVFAAPPILRSELIGLIVGVCKPLEDNLELAPDQFEADISYELGRCLVGQEVSDSYYKPLEGLFLRLQDQGKNLGVALAFYEHCANKQAPDYSYEAAFLLCHAYASKQAYKQEINVFFGEVEADKSKVLKYFKLLLALEARDSKYGSWASDMVQRIKDAGSITFGKIPISYQELGAGIKLEGAEPSNPAVAVAGPPSP